MGRDSHHSERHGISTLEDNPSEHERLMKKKTRTGGGKDFSILDSGNLILEVAFETLSGRLTYRVPPNSLRLPAGSLVHYGAFFCATRAWEDGGDGSLRRARFALRCAPGDGAYS